MVSGKAQLELRHGGFKIVPAVGKTAATDHEIPKVGEVRLSDVFISLADLLHCHGGQRQCAIQQGLERRGHPVAVQREAPDQQIASKDLVQNLPHIVVMDAGSAVSHTGKAAGAVFDVLVDHMDDMYLLGRSRLHPIQKGTGDVHGVAVLPFGTSVQYKDFHSLSPYRCAFRRGKLGGISRPH